MRVCFIIPNLRGGGAERVAINLLRGLPKHKYKLTLVVLDLADAAYLDDVPPEVEMVHLGVSRVRSAIIPLVRYIIKSNPDVVFSNLGHLNVALGLALPLLPNRIRFVARESGIVSEELRSRRYAPVWRFLTVIAYKQWDVVICQSRYMKDDLVRNFRVPEDKAFVINNPVDVNRVRELASCSSGSDSGFFSLDCDEKTVRFVAAGRLVPEKGFDTLICALALFRNVDFTLTILGHGPLLSQLVNLVEELGLSRKIEFVGFQRNPFSFFRKADAFILCSHFEAFPNVVLEALSCGAPIIYTPAVGGLVEIVGSLDCCYGASDFTPESLFVAISSWFRNRDSCRVHESVVDVYRSENVVEEYDRLLSQD